MYGLVLALKISVKSDLCPQKINQRAIVEKGFLSGYLYQQFNWSCPANINLFDQPGKT